MNFFVLLLVSFFLSNCFVIYSTIKYIVPRNFKIGATIFLIGISSLMYIYQIYSFYFSNNFPYKLNQILSYLIYYFMGFIIYAGFLYLIALIIKIIIGINLYKLAFIGTFFILLVGTYFKNSTVVKEYKIKNNNITPLNIVLVSDIHLGYINGKNFAKKLVNDINRLNPDIVLMAGDIIDLHLKPVIEENMLDNFKNIKSRYGIYINIGNHEIYGRRTDEFTKILNSYKNIKVLRDDKILIDDNFYVASRDNHSKKQIKDILKDVENKPILFMEHIPNNIDEAVKNNIFLQVSGHTHKRQIFPGNLFTKKIFKVDYGYKKIKNSNIVVSSGYGSWGPPIRIGSRSEIVSIKLN